VADVIQVVDPDTFVRPTYAGNAIATVKYSAPGLRMMSVGDWVSHHAGHAC
jgi:electron transfer flavoprotein alpha subunit